MEYVRSRKSSVSEDLGEFQKTVMREAVLLQRWWRTEVYGSPDEANGIIATKGNGLLTRAGDRYEEVLERMAVLNSGTVVPLRKAIIQSDSSLSLLIQGVGSLDAESDTPPVRRSYRESLFEIGLRARKFVTGFDDALIDLLYEENRKVVDEDLRLQEIIGSTNSTFSVESVEPTERSFKREKKRLKLGIASLRTWWTNMIDGKHNQPGLFRRSRHSIQGDVYNRVMIVAMENSNGTLVLPAEISKKLATLGQQVSDLKWRDARLLPVYVESLQRYLYPDAKRFIDYFTRALHQVLYDISSKQEIEESDHFSAGKNSRKSISIPTRREIELL